MNQPNSELAHKSRRYFRQSPKIDETLNYYTHSIFCANCQKGNVLYIQKGTTVADVIGTVMCENCNCNVK